MGNVCERNGLYLRWTEFYEYFEKKLSVIIWITKKFVYWASARHIRRSTYNANVLQMNSETFDLCMWKAFDRLQSNTHIQFTNGIVTKLFEPHIYTHFLHQWTNFFVIIYVLLSVSFAWFVNLA